MEYKELLAAMKFGIMPHEFYKAPKESQVRAIAIVEAQQRLDEYFMPEPERENHKPKNHR